MSFIAHFLNTPVTSLLEMDATDIRQWHTDAVKLYKQLNKNDG